MRRAGRVQLALAIAAVGLGACGDKAASTLLVAKIESDLTVTGQLDEVRLVVKRPDGKGERTLKFALGAGGATLPVTAGLLPASGGESEELTLTAQAFKAGAGVVETEAVVAFVMGQRRQIRMFLAAACATSTCSAADQTCSAGGACIPRRRSSEPLDVGADAATGVDAPAGVDAPMQDAPVGIDAPDAPLGDDAGNCTCPSDDNPCTQDFCMGGTCRHVPLGNRFGCPGGLCIDGSCCTGCIDNMGRCRVGNNVLFCGNAARDCVVCNDQDPCTQDGCMDGACRTMPVSGPTCATGVCVNGQCRCGNAMEPCCAGGVCTPGMSCSGGTCGGCGGDGQDCCSSNVCGPGLLCTSNKCGKCGDVGQPCCADGSCRGGICAGAARVCQPCGGQGQPCCPTGDACGQNLACTNGVCACGGQGQPCCGGMTCTSDNNACNGMEMCANGVCSRSPAVVCTPRSQCHLAGMCDPASGRCTEPVKGNGSFCNDGNGCTSGDQCRDGACISTGVTVCNDNNACTDDTCVAPMGCVFTNTPAQKSCVPPGVQCRADACDGNGRCVFAPGMENQTCRLPTGANGACRSGACCPILGGPCASPI